MQNELNKMMMKNCMKILKINFQLFLTKKPIIYFFVLFFMSSSIFCQITNNNQQVTKMNFKYGVNIKLNINEEVQFDDNLSIVLTSFSHKHPFVGGSTKAIAYVTLSKNEISEENSLSIHGIEGKPHIEYGSLLWNEYEFQLKAFNYDESIEIIVNKRK